MIVFKQCSGIVIYFRKGWILVFLNDYKCIAYYLLEHHELNLSMRISTISRETWFIDPWFGIETQLLIYSAWLSLLSSNL